MSLRYAILGFLSSTPSTGYDLGRAFSLGAGAYWEASSSQIYPELQRLEREKLIEGEVSQSDRLNRRVYRLTKKGKQELQRWVESDVDYPPRRDPERIQFLFLDESNRETIRLHLERHRAHYERVLAAFRSIHQSLLDRTHPRLKDRLASHDRKDWNLIVGLKRLATEGDIGRAEFELRWCKQALEWLEKLSPQEVPSSPASDKRENMGRRRRNAKRAVGQ
jgi:PadR family transcriptional regulator, regulatory protein AphA